MSLWKYLNFSCQVLVRKRGLSEHTGFACSIYFVNKRIINYCSMADTKPDSGIRPLVLCGPSGSGKSSLLTRLFKKYPDNFGFSVSHTTRKPRPGEIDGVHYHFTDKDLMQQAIGSKKFIEHAVYSGNLYGTSKSSVYVVMKAGKICVLDIDVQGARQIKETDLDPLMVFVQPPSIDELEKRLRSRQTETEESLNQRLNFAKSELEYGLTPNNFHKIFINENLDSTYDEFEKYILESYAFLCNK